MEAEDEVASGLRDEAGSKGLRSGDLAVGVEQRRAGVGVVSESNVLPAEVGERARHRLEVMRLAIGVPQGRRERAGTAALREAACQPQLHALRETVR